MLKESVTKALEDAGLKYSDIQQAAVGYVYGMLSILSCQLFFNLFHWWFDMWSTRLIYRGSHWYSYLQCQQQLLHWQHCFVLYVVYFFFLKNYSIWSNATFSLMICFWCSLVARQLVAGGVCDCALACGFEQMKPGSLQSAFNDRTNPMDNHFKVMIEQRGFAPVCVCYKYSSFVLFFLIFSVWSIRKPQEQPNYLVMLERSIWINMVLLLVTLLRLVTKTTNTPKTILMPNFKSMSLRKMDSQFERKSITF